MRYNYLSRLQHTLAEIKEIRDSLYFNIMSKPLSSKIDIATRILERFGLDLLDEWDGEILLWHCFDRFHFVWSVTYCKYINRIIDIYIFRSSFIEMHKLLSHIKKVKDKTLVSSPVWWRTEFYKIVKVHDAECNNCNMKDSALSEAIISDKL